VSALAVTLIGTLAATLIAMLLLWLLASVRSDVSVVDIYWGAGFILVASLSVAWNRPVHLRGAVALLLVCLWGIRLASYLLWRKWGEDEDRRYQAMRQHHGARFWWVSLFTVFLLQGILLWVIAMPLQVIAVSRDVTFATTTDVIGLLLWIVGFAFQAIGDMQLVDFQSQPENRDRVLNRGLWRYTRHPNYFGESLMWWGLYLLSLSAGGGWTVFSPILITTLLLKVSGVTLMESTIADRRPEYADYRRRTSAFVPWLPRP
jgi:steroid 5-alpha reductase family enzyme